jgi:hypothetical protein
VILAGRQISSQLDSSHLSALTRSKDQIGTMTEPIYNYSNIRKLLSKGFSEEELRTLCFDVPGLRAVQHEISRGYSKSEIIAKLLEHAERTMQIDTLLAILREQNPVRYDKHQPYYLTDSTASLQKQVVQLTRQLSAIRVDRDATLVAADAEAQAIYIKNEARIAGYANLIEVLRNSRISDEAIDRIITAVVIADLEHIGSATEDLSFADDE